MQRTQATGYRSKANPSQPGGPSWVARWGVVLKVTFCGFPGAARILRTWPGGGNPGGLGPLILNPTDCHRRQDTGYKIQDTAYSIHIQAYRSRGIRRCKYARMHRTQATGYSSKADSSQPGGPSKEGLADLHSGTPGTQDPVQRSP